MYKRILVPTDGSELTGRAVAAGVGLAKLLGAEVHTLCVKEPFPYGAVAEMQPTPPQEFFDAQERIGGTPRARRDGSLRGRRRGLPCRDDRRHAAVGGDRRARGAEGLRPDRHGLARSQRPGLALPRQRDRRTC